MRIERSIGTVMLGFWMTLVHAASQGPRPEAHATGIIEGTVVTPEEKPRPIGGATVGIAGRGSVQRVLTDDAGQFRLTNLPTGQYHVVATKAAYLRSEYGAKEIGGQGTALVLAPQSSLHLTIPLYRGGVLTGVIRQNGEPIADVVVTAQTSSGKEHQVWTNHDGEYRVYGLLPGQYLIEAKPHLIMRTLPVGAIPLSLATVDSALAQLRTAAAGGDFSAVSTTTPRGRGGPIGTITGYAPVYFPGTADRQHAAAVPLAAGEERSGLDFELLLRGSAGIRGHVVGPSGTSPKVASVTATAVGRSFSTSANGGNFEIRNVPPGHYTLEARVIEGWGDGRLPTGASPVSLTWWAVEEVDIDDGVLDGVPLTLQPPMTLSGRVILEGGQAPPASVARVTLRKSGLENEPLTTVSAVTNTRGEFRLTGIGPGNYILDVTGGAVAGEPLWLRSVAANGRDLLDHPLEFGGQTRDLPDVIVTLSTRHTMVSGTLRGLTGDRTSAYHIVLFSTQVDHWYRKSRRVLSTRPAADGTFAFTDVPPGDYYIAALTAQPALWQTPDFLSSIVAASLRLTLHDGEHLKQDIQLSR